MSSSNGRISNRDSLRSQNHLIIIGHWVIRLIKNLVLLEPRARMDKAIQNHVTSDHLETDLSVISRKKVD